MTGRSPPYPRDIRGQARISFAVAVLLLAGCVTPSTVSSPPTAPAATKDADRGHDVATFDELIDDPSRETVLMLQSQLRARGYDPGPLDGLLGPRTRAAMTAYARDAGLPVTPGGISKRLLAELDVTASGDPGRRTDQTMAPLPPGDVPPAYRPGDAYVYSDGRVEIVDAVDGDMVAWRGQDDSGFRASRNFVLPRVFWRTGTRIGMRRLSAAPDILWPLTVGRRASFTADAVLMRDSDRQDRTAWRETWDCEVAGIETVDVPAGRFDTFRVVCFRQVRPRGVAWRRVWHYAPAVRHYIRRIDSHSDGSPPRVVDLVAVRLGGAGWPPAARTGLSWALADGLENRPDGESFTWQSSGVDGVVRIEIGTTSRDAAGATCRSYAQVLTEPGGERRYPGFVCRGPSGGWNAPG